MRSLFSIVIILGLVVLQANCRRENEDRSEKRLLIQLTSMTTMACFPQTKEKLFTDLLAAVNGFEIDSKGTLTLHATNGSTITTRRE